MRSTLRWLLASWGANLRSALEYRVAFLVQAGFMAANNLLFLAFWALFFRRFEHLGGWGLADLALLYGVAATAFGAGVVLFGGVLDLARRVADGRLDTWLLRPRPVLLQATVSRLQVSGVGDLATGVLLVIASGPATPGRLATWLGLSVLATASFVAFCTLVGSLAFWLGRSETVAQQAVHALVMFSLYPPSLFGGWAKVVLFVLVPAGLMSWLPAQLVRSWSWRDAGLLAAGVTALVLLAGTAWCLGLARYESGNLTQAVES
jgi:ABC-2 type transport system permease protein